MFYQLLTIDDRPLPADIVIYDTSYLVIRGGLLLEPPDPAREGREGHSVLKFLGPLRSETIESLASSAEPFRWLRPGTLDISRSDSLLGARFRGRQTGEALELVAEPGAGFIPSRTLLGFVAAPSAEIIDDWRDTFNFGPPFFQPVDPALRDDPEIQAAIAEAIVAGEPARRQAALTRLEMAWRAPA
jgi:hypothetical protein